MTTRTKLDVYQSDLYETDFIGSLRDDAWYGIDMMFHFVRWSSDFVRWSSDGHSNIHDDLIYDLRYFSGNLCVVADLLLDLDEETNEN
jgi:hypothetical protein